MISAGVLRRVRNELPMWSVIAALDRDGPPSKIRDGRFVFLCPWCGEMLVAVNPRNNPAHCFGCGKNFNNIDLLLACEYDFCTAVAVLQEWLHKYRSERSKRCNGSEVIARVGPVVNDERLRNRGAVPLRRPPPEFTTIRETDRSCRQIHTARIR